MTSGGSATILSMHDLREVASYAAECAQKVLEIFENAHQGTLAPATQLTRPGHLRGAANAGKPCATPPGRHKKRPRTQALQPQATRREQPCARRRLPTCTH